MNFSEKLYQLRMNKGYSQENVADALHVSRQAVSKWESGVLPDTDKIIQLSELFGVSTDFLLKNTSVDQTDDALGNTIFRLLGSAQDMDMISKNLISIMKDGKIDEQEMKEMSSIMDSLDDLVETIQELKMLLEDKRKQP